MTIVFGKKCVPLGRSLCFFLVALLFCTTTAAAPADPADKQGLKPILNYISQAWDTLTRSMTSCESIVDPKIAETPVLYLPAGLEEPASVRELSGKCKGRIEHLPRKIYRLGELTSGNIDPPGLLYVRNKYVVPGGLFQEGY